ncbi:hypothetical protein H106_02376 [Trichophyton rubrum CBS 735.88]|nr:hypothetical protein H106_02376 [Trichophyton rubrum CBS 735.88]
MGTEIQESKPSKEVEQGLGRTKTQMPLSLGACIGYLPSGGRFYRPNGYRKLDCQKAHKTHDGKGRLHNPQKQTAREHHLGHSSHRLDGLLGDPHDHGHGRLGHRGHRTCHHGRTWHSGRRLCDHSHHDNRDDCHGHCRNRSENCDSRHRIGVHGHHTHRDDRHSDHNDRLDCVHEVLVFIFVFSKSLLSIVETQGETIPRLGGPKYFPGVGVLGRLRRAFSMLKVRPSITSPCRPSLAASAWSGVAMFTNPNPRDSLV